MSKNTDSCRSWFCVLNNPEKLFENLTPSEIVDRVIEMWCENKPQRSCAVNYEIGDNQTPHLHMVLEDPSKTRFTAVQKLFPSIHIEPTRGTKEQAQDYIHKRGKFEEKGHTVVIPARFHGEIKANKGNRRDLQIIQELIEDGKTPDEIMDISINYRNHESLIRKAYFRKRSKETPSMRSVNVVWHVGESGCGKSYTYKQLCDIHGEDNVYLLTDYENGGFDSYCGQPILFMDEYKGSMKFQVFLNLLDVYKTQIHCRYSNAYALWNEVHITSIFPPERAYSFMVNAEQQSDDKILQLYRRINTIIYHYKDGNDYKLFSLPMSQYTTYEALKTLALSDSDGFMKVTEDLSMFE